MQRTSTCSGVQWSMLMDLTFVMCTPTLRCMVAHRRQRKMPSYHNVNLCSTCITTLIMRRSPRLESKACHVEGSIATYVPTGPSCPELSALMRRWSRRELHTWILVPTVCALVIGIRPAADFLLETLQRALVARLLALVGCHDAVRDAESGEER